MKAFKKTIKVKKSELDSFGEDLDEQIELYCGERFRASGLFFHVDSIRKMDNFYEIELDLRQIIPTECIKTIKIPNKYLTHFQVGELIDVTLYSMILSQIHGGCDFVILDKENKGNYTEFLITTINREFRLDNDNVVEWCYGEVPSESEERYDFIDNLISEFILKDIKVVDWQIEIDDGRPILNLKLTPYDPFLYLSIESKSSNSFKEYVEKNYEIKELLDCNVSGKNDTLQIYKRKDF